MYCTYCGKENKIGEAYCIHCGKLIGTPAAVIKKPTEQIQFNRAFWGGVAGIVTGGLALLGFLLPSVSFNYYFSLIGSYYSGSTALIALVSGTVLAFISIFSPDQSGVFFQFLLLLVGTALVALFPIMSFLIGRDGFLLTKLSRTDLEQRFRRARMIKRRAVTAFISLALCYIFVTAGSSLAGLSFYTLGGATVVGVGFWFMLFGIILAYLTGVYLSSGAKKTN